MSRFQPEHWVGLSANTLAWNTGGQRGNAEWHTSAWNGSVDTLQMLLSTELKSKPCSVLLAPSIIRHWLQAPAMGVTSLRELHTVALARAHQLFGAANSAAHTNSAWHVSGDWSATKAFLCKAWPSHLTGLNQSLFSPFVLALASHRTQLPRSGWLAVTIAGELYLLQVQHGHPVSFRSVRLGQIDTQAELQNQLLLEWQRDQLRNPSLETADQRIHWLHLMPTALDAVKSASIVYINTSPLRAVRVGKTSQTMTPGESEACLVAWTGQYFAGVTP